MQQIWFLQKFKVIRLPTTRVFFRRQVICWCTKTTLHSCYRKSIVGFYFAKKYKWANEMALEPCGRSNEAFTVRVGVDYANQLDCLRGFWRRGRAWKWSLNIYKYIFKKKVEWRRDYGNFVQNTSKQHPIIIPIILWMSWKKNSVLV